MPRVVAEIDGDAIIHNYRQIKKVYQDTQELWLLLRLTHTAMER